MHQPAIARLARGHGFPGAPQAREEGPMSDGRQECASQTQYVSSQRSHFGDIPIAPAQGSAALAEEKRPVWIFRSASLIRGVSCVDVAKSRQNL
jgi:hypothetical protein